MQLQKPVYLSCLLSFSMMRVTTAIAFFVFVHALSVTALVYCDTPFRRSGSATPLWYRLACRSAVQAMRDTDMPPGTMHFYGPGVARRGGMNLALPRQYHAERKDIPDLCAVTLDFPGRYQWTTGAFEDVIMAATSIIDKCMYHAQSFPASGEAMIFGGRMRIKTFLNADPNLLAMYAQNSTQFTTNGEDGNMVSSAKRFAS